MKNILIAEDEDEIREVEKINLERAGYNVVDVNNGKKALDAFNKAKEPFDIVMLDITMPEMDGFTVCKKIREVSDSVGIIMVSARTQDIDKVNGLMIGADDYISKPFTLSEFTARVDAIYRRVGVHSNKVVSDEIKSGPFVLNKKSHTIYKNNVALDLTNVEYEIMELFMSNPNIAFERKQILEAIWGKDFAGDEKVVDVNIRRMRIKVEDDPRNPVHVDTIWGIGYKWNP